MRQVIGFGVLLIGSLATLVLAQGETGTTTGTTPPVSTPPAPTTPPTPTPAGPIPTEYWVYVGTLLFGYAVITAGASWRKSFLWELLYDQEIKKPSASRYIAILGAFTVTVTFVLALRFGFADLVRGNDSAFFNDAVRNVFIGGFTVFLPYIAGKVLEASSNAGAKAAEKNKEAAATQAEAAVVAAEKNKDAALIQKDAALIQADARVQAAKIASGQA